MQKHARLNIAKGCNWHSYSGKQASAEQKLRQSVYVGGGHGGWGTPGGWRTHWGDGVLAQCAWMLTFLYSLCLVTWCRY